MKEVLDKEASELQPKLEALQSLVNEVTTELYKNATPPPGADGQQGADGATADGATAESDSTDEPKTN